MFGGARKHPSNSVHTFSNVPSTSIQRSAFDRSHSYRTTTYCSYLTPILVDEVLPGDTVSCKLSSFARLSTPLKPIFDNLYCHFYFFFVPNRLVWDNWEKFNGAQDNPGDSTSFLVPTCTSPVNGYAALSLQDFMGLPVAGQIASGKTLTHNNLPMRAYNLIWNEWFRDENLQNSVTVDKGDGPDNPANYGINLKGKVHDYFTSCLPFAQKGPAVTLPLGSQAAIRSNGTPDAYGRTEVYFTAQGNNSFDSAINFQGSVPNALVPNATPPAGGPNTTWPKLTDSFYNYADLSTATAATINQLRTAFQVQRLFERDARGGTRYTEILRSHFGVISPDMRLQRPEYLGGGRSKINIYPVAQTSESGVTTPQGNMAGYGVHAAHGIGFSKSFVEHGYIIGLMCPIADLSYQQGLDRMWSREQRFDFFWPALSHIGEQAVLNQEIFCDGSGSSGNDGGVFGYQERYAEYRYKPSRITGEFRSTYSTPLDFWHMSQKFATLPTLGGLFITDSAIDVMPRILADSLDVQILFDAWFTYKWARPMPTYSVPGWVDHF